MSQIAIAPERTDAEILQFDIADEDLEAAAEAGKRQAGAQTIPYALICIPFERA